MTVLERSESAPRHDQALALDSRSGAVAALIAFALSLGTAILGLAFTYRGLAVVWPAAGVVTGLWLVTPARHRYPVVAGITAGLLAGNLIAGRTLLLNVMFIGANLGEAWLVTALLRRWIGQPIQLSTLRQVGWFILAVALTVTIGGAIGAIGLARVRPSGTATSTTGSCGSVAGNRHVDRGSGRDRPRDHAAAIPGRDVARRQGHARGDGGTGAPGVRAGQFPGFRRTNCCRCCSCWRSSIR